MHNLNHEKNHFLNKRVLKKIRPRINAAKSQIKYAGCYKIKLVNVQLICPAQSSGPGAKLYDQKKNRMFGYFKYEKDGEEYWNIIEL